MPPIDAARLDVPPTTLALLRDLLARHVPRAAVWAYGSRVVGGAHEGSDLDIVLRNARDASAEIEGADDLREAVQQSLIPLLVEIHLWPHLPERFHQQIEQAYAVLQPGRPL